MLEIILASLFITKDLLRNVKLGYLFQNHSWTLIYFNISQFKPISLPFKSQLWFKNLQTLFLLVILKYWSNCNRNYIFLYYLFFCIFIYVFSRLLDTQKLNKKNNEMNKIAEKTFIWVFFLILKENATKHIKLSRKCKDKISQNITWKYKIVKK